MTELFVKSPWFNSKDVKRSLCQRRRIMVVMQKRIPFAMFYKMRKIKVNGISLQCRLIMSFSFVK